MEVYCYMFCIYEVGISSCIDGRYEGRYEAAFRLTSLSRIDGIGYFLRYSYSAALDMRISLGQMCVVATSLTLLVCFEVGYEVSAGGMLSWSAWLESWFARKSDRRSQKSFTLRRSTRT